MLLDVFNSDPFTTTSLTAAINKAPYKPARIGQMGLYRRVPISTLSVFIEEMEGKLSLLTTKRRGGGGSTMATRETRKVRPFSIYHIPHDDALLADDIQGVRAFGSEMQLEILSQKTNEKLMRLRQNHEATHEYHRIGGIKGIITDGDGSTELLNLFTEFGLSQQLFYFDFANNTSIKTTCMEVYDWMEEAVGASPWTSIHAMVGKTFWKELLTSPEVEAAFDRANNGSFLRENQTTGSRSFEYCGITWESYRGAVGATKFVADDAAHFFPVGVPDLFLEHFGPADFIETVNTMGVPVYVKQETMKFDKGVELHSQSNPLYICTRPGLLGKGLSTAAP